MTKFINAAETSFQSTVASLWNQHASTPNLENQIGQLVKIISERPQGSLSNNTESNLRVQFNTITLRSVRRVAKWWKREGRD